MCFQRVRPFSFSPAALILAALLVCGCSDDESDRLATPTTLRDAANRSGLLIGAGFVEGSHTDEFREVLVREYNSVTAPLYWTSTENERGRLDFDIPDFVVELAQEHGLRVRGDALAGLSEGHR